MGGHLAAAKSSQSFSSSPTSVSVGKFLTSDMERFGGKGVAASESVTVHAKNNKTMGGGRSREGEGLREEARTLRRLGRARTCPELCAEIGVWHAGFGL